MNIRRASPAFYLSASALLFLCCGLADAYAQKDGEDIAIGKYQVVRSQVLNEDRLLFVHLPPDYAESRVSYPVLYLLWVDIYNYFADAAIITEKLGSSGEAPPMIIVGVANTDRYRDSLPVKNRDTGQGGGADNFLRFLGDELIPHIDKTYRTKDFRILAGPQAGAIFGLYALMAKPGLFQAFLTGNPFLNRDNAEFLFLRAEEFFKKTESFRKFLYIRCENNEPAPALEYAGKLSGLLGSKKPRGFRFTVEIAEPSGYFIPPLPFRDGLRALFAGHKFPADLSVTGLKDILRYYEALSAEYGFEVDPPPHLLTMKGAELGRQRKTREAVEVFEYMLGRNPRSLDALWQLGETFRALGEYEKARECYKRFLEVRDVDAAMIRTRLGQVDRILGGSAAYRVEQEIKRNGLRAGLKTYRALRSGPQAGIYFEEGEFNALGYRLMGAGKMREAIEIFKLNVELYPGSANAHDSLAEAYMNSGDAGKAIKHYRRSLELEPGNANAKRMLKELEKKGE